MTLKVAFVAECMRFSCSIMCEQEELREQSFNNDFVIELLAPHAELSRAVLDFYQENQISFKAVFKKGLSMRGITP